MRYPNLLLAFFLASLAVEALVASSSDLPVPPPVQCDGNGCTISYYQHIWLDRTPCKASKALYIPTSEQELIQAVAYAAQTKTKVKVVSKGSHSIPKLVCPGGTDGLIISTRDYSSQIIVNTTDKTVTADAGVMLRDLVDKIAEHGLALPHTPYWEGVSVAGMISTGAHGSGMWGMGSSAHDYVVGIKLITAASEEDGYAKVIDLTAKDEDLNAARVSLGVLGAISKVTFQLEPMFKRSVTLEIRSDEHLEDEILDFAKEYEFGGFSWYPSSGKSLFKLDNRVSVETPGDGAYKLATLDKMEVEFVETLTSAMELSEVRRNNDELCAGADYLLNHRYTSGDGLANSGNTFTSFPVIGYNHNMQTAGGCDRVSTPTLTATGLKADGKDAFDIYNMGMTDTRKLLTCSWNHLIKGFFFFDVAISVPAARIGEVIREIKKLRDASPQGMCGFGHLGGIWIRFVKGSEAYLGEREDAVVFEMLYYRSREAHKPRFNEDITEEIEQMLLNKYGGKPHWGKNRNLAFEGMAARTRAMDKFLEARERLDPLALFSSEWSDAILGISSPSASSPYSSNSPQIMREHCALEGLCVCRQDSHCHPAQGYFCRPGLVYKEARVCRYEEQVSSS